MKAAYKMPEPLVSVVVATFERADLLRRCLHALVRQTFDPAAFEIIVVDNDSADATRETVQRVAAANHGGPAIRYVLETTRGVSWARNAGLREARGSILCCVDDDAIAPPEWIGLMVDAFRTVKPAPQVVGGPAFPLYTGRRPSWYKDAYETASWGDRPRYLGRFEYFYGLNVAFDKDLLVKAGGFDTGLGMKGHVLGFAEDAEVFDRLGKAAGGRLNVYYLPKTAVLHAIPDARLSPLYRVKRGFANGRGLYDWDTRRLPDVPWVGPLVPAGAQRPALLAWGLLRLGMTLGKTVLLSPRTPQPQNWLIERGVPLARRSGYLAAAAGITPAFLRSK